MKFVIVLAALVAITSAETYTTENDNFDIEALMANPGEFEKFTGCFLDLNPCDAVAGDFKKDLKEVFSTACAKCTDAQKHLFRRYLAGLGEKFPEKLQAFKNKYDSENKYFAALEKAVAQA